MVIILIWRDFKFPDIDWNTNFTTVKERHAGYFLIIHSVRYKIMSSFELNFKK